MIQLSVIIPTRNRESYLYIALESIVYQTISQELFEVIIIDNGSSDNTRKVVNNFKNKILNLIYIYDDNPGLHVGRHRGLFESKADILVYADDDIKALPTWLEGIIETFQDENVVLVGGKNLPWFESTPPEWIYNMWNINSSEKIISYLSLIDLGDEIKEISPYYVFGCNFSIRKSVLIEAGGFHPDGMPIELIKYRGDGETYVSQYISRKGYKTLYNPKASVYHMVSKERVTKKYFNQRAFHQGISESFNDIRNGNIRSFRKYIIKLSIKKYLMKKDTSIEESFIDGYKYHQNECRKDPLLLQWVKRSNYINNWSIK